MTQKPRKWLFE